MVVAVIGASANRNKFGNKAVRAHMHRGFDVYPVNLTEKTIEGLATSPSILDIPVSVDRAVVYLPPEITFDILEEIAKKGVKEVYFNPGSSDERVVEKAKELGIKPILACSIVAIGESPASYE